MWKTVKIYQNATDITKANEHLFLNNFYSMIETKQENLEFKLKFGHDLQILKFVFIFGRHQIYLLFSLLCFVISDQTILKSLAEGYFSFSFGYFPFFSVQNGPDTVDKFTSRN